MYLLVSVQRKVLLFDWSRACSPENFQQSTVSCVHFRRVGKEGGSWYIVCTANNYEMFFDMFNLLLARKNTFFNSGFHTKIKLILKTIGNRKGDCAWSCSRWQTQPEKICKSQRTNQCHSLRTLYWFVLCNLQIFSGCVCHLEQLHAQSPFLFPIVFSINLIPFFDICSVDLLVLLAVFQPGSSGQ